MCFPCGRRLRPYPSSLSPAAAAAPATVPTIGLNEPSDASAPATGAAIVDSSFVFLRNLFVGWITLSSILPA